MYLELSSEFRNSVFDTTPYHSALFEKKSNYVKALKTIFED